jgi:hypothetical protein
MEGYEKEEAGVQVSKAVTGQIVRTFSIGFRFVLVGYTIRNKSSRGVFSQHYWLSWLYINIQNRVY